MRKGLLVISGLMCLTFVTQSALAGPWWNTGDPSTTHQIWTFDDPNTTGPEVNGNPYGMPLAEIYSAGFFALGPEWSASWQGREGVWRAESLEFALQIPNQEVDNPRKEIWLQIDFLGQLGSFSVSPIPVGGGTVGLISQTTELLSDGWKRLNALWYIEPNPNEEYVCYSFYGGAAVDRVVVDTICIPEPLTICFLGLGGIMLLRRHRMS